MKRSCPLFTYKRELSTYRLLQVRLVFALSRLPFTSTRVEVSTCVRELTAGHPHAEPTLCAFAEVTARAATAAVIASLFKVLIDLCFEGLF
ncbi:MAG: hypothetical protein IPO90_17070 [Flavobacteriales bacterium]|nr:hypothetical protein [Flavobacteriales bacterium]